jgi:hypothetical protein
MNEQHDPVDLSSRPRALSSTPVRAAAGAAALALVIAANGWGCLSAEGEPAATGTAIAAIMTYPSTCAQVAMGASGLLDDGEYLLFVGGDPAKPWVAYCLGMGGVGPKEYLTLHRTGAGSNYSQYTAGGSSPGIDVRSYYTKVRIDPSTLAIDSSDQTFSTSTGQLDHGGTTVTSMPFGVAMSCSTSFSGIGNVDVQGTPFSIPSLAFVLGGANPQGAPSYSPTNQAVSLTGRGNCGYLQPAPGVFNPFNNRGGAFLHVAHL